MLRGETLEVRPRCRVLRLMTDLVDERARARTPRPSFLTGTSFEYLGDRPLPRVVRERPLVFVLGPSGVGKSLVARELASAWVKVLDTQQLQAAILERVRKGRWALEIEAVDSLVLDGPVWLHNRPAVVDLLTELLEQGFIECGGACQVIGANCYVSLHKCHPQFVF